MKSYTRRQALTTLGLIGAAAVAGPSMGYALPKCPEDTTHDCNSIYVVFEGPWIFCRAADCKRVRAIADMTDPTATVKPSADRKHYCLCGKWNRHTNKFHPHNVRRGSVWEALVEDYTPTGVFKNVLAPYMDGQHQGVYVPPGCSVTAVDGIDISVTLPAPDVVVLNSVYVRGTVSGDAGTMRPCVDAIFRYKNVQRGFFTFGDKKTSVGPFRAGDDCIFRLKHSGDGMTSTAHEYQKFNAMKKKIMSGTSTINLDLTLPDACIEQPPSLEGIGPDELGISHMCRARHDHLYDSSMSNCDGGNIAVG